MAWYHGNSSSMFYEAPSEYYCTLCDAQMNCDEMWESHMAGKRHLKNMEKEKQLPSKLFPKASRPQASITASHRPDRSRSDFYCKICDSHMNSEEIWESHVAGKRHLENLSMASRERKSKAKSVKLNATPRIQKDLDCIEEPLVGLDFMQELIRAESYLPPSYSCFLCNAYLQKSAIMEHIVSIKHKMAFLRVRCSDQYSILKGTDLTKEAVNSIIEGMVSEYESKHGRGTMEVKLEKK